MKLARIGLVILAGSLSAAGALAAQTTSEEVAQRMEIAAARAEDAAVVDCQLPGKLMKLGGTRTYQSPGRLTRLPAIDCRVRGGEYTLGDLSAGTFSLERWLPLAEKGEAEAQYYVARIYVNGMSGVPVDYAAAARWYGRAADQGYASAQTELGYLYEQGLGVEQDLKLALDLQRKGAGLGEELDFAWKIAATREEAERQIADLGLRLEESNAALDSLRDELGRTRGSLSDSRAKLARTQAAVAGLRADLEAAQSAGTAADPARVKALESDLAARQAELQARNARVAQLEGELTSRESQLDASLSNSQATNAKLNQIRTAARSANLQVDDLRAQLQQAELRLTNAREELSRERDRYKRDVDGLVAKNQKALEALRARPAQAAKPGAGEEAARLAQQLAAANAALAARERTLASLENNTEMLRDQVKRLQGSRTAEVARNRSETQRLQEQLAQQRNELEKAEVVGATMEKSLADTRTRLEREKAQRQANQNQVAALELEVQNQRRQIEAHQAQIAGLRALVNKAEPAAAAPGTPPAARPPLVAKADPSSPAQRLIAKARSLNRGTYYALVIGNTNYASMARLDTGVPDAEAVQRMLEQDYDFKVELLRDASRDDIVMALNAWSRKLREDDSFLVYYAGRSYSMKPGQESWLGIEADPTTMAGYLDSNNIQSQIQQMRAKSVLVVADCCLAGANTHATTTRLGRGLDERYFQITFENRARLVLTSSPAARAAAASASRGHSPFAENFLQVLRASRIVMSGQELACELGERLQPVGSQTRSDLTPIYSVLTGAGHDNGEFFFIPSPAVSAGAERVAAVL